MLSRLNGILYKMGFIFRVWIGQNVSGNCTAVISSVTLGSNLRNSLLVQVKKKTQIRHRAHSWRRIHGESSRSLCKETHVCSQTKRGSEKLTTQKFNSTSEPQKWIQRTRGWERVTIPVWQGLWIESPARTSRLPHVLGNPLTDGGEIVSLTRRPGTNFCSRLTVSRPQGHSAAGRMKSIEEI
jgi:hypothetical protein